MLTLEFLVGRWRNDFMLDGIPDFEICEIDASGRYFVDGVHWFNVVDFSHDGTLGSLRFTKSAVMEGDARQFVNDISKFTLDFLENATPAPGQSTYSISYSRL